MNTKTGILTLILGGALVFAAACSNAPTTTNSNASLVQSNNANSISHGNMMTNRNGMPAGGNHDMSTMPHGGGEVMIGQSDANAANAPYDLQFIDTMTHHHEGALRMSEMVLNKSQNEELKKFARQIIADQNKEIARMKEWREKWFAAQPRALNMEMPGMSNSMKMMEGGEMGKMKEAAGKQFDVHFLEMMIPHHQDAVTMSKDALRKAERAEIKTLADQIIKAQEAEIKLMNEWKEKWSK